MKEVTNCKNDADLSKILNVTQSSIIGWRKRDTIPYKQIDYICKTFSVSYDYILYGDLKDYYINELAIMVGSKQVAKETIIENAYYHLRSELINIGINDIVTSGLFMQYFYFCADKQVTTKPSWILYSLFMKIAKNKDNKKHKDVILKAIDNIDFINNSLQVLFTKKRREDLKSFIKNILNDEESKQLVLLSDKLYIFFKELIFCNTSKKYIKDGNA